MSSVDLKHSLFLEIERLFLAYVCLHFGKLARVKYAELAIRSSCLHCTHVCTESTSLEYCHIEENLKTCSCPGVKRNTISLWSQFTDIYLSWTSEIMIFSCTLSVFILDWVMTQGIRSVILQIEAVRLMYLRCLHELCVTANPATTPAHRSAKWD